MGEACSDAGIGRTPGSSDVPIDDPALSTAATMDDPAPSAAVTLDNPETGVFKAAATALPMEVAETAPEETTAVASDAMDVDAHEHTDVQVAHALLPPADAPGADPAPSDPLCGDADGADGADDGGLVLDLS